MKMTKRIISLCLIAFLIFALFALSACNDKADEQKPADPYEGLPQGKNLIYIIGDGMGFNHIENTKLHMGVDSLRFEEWYACDVTTHSANNSVTDSAAGATALATGVKTNNEFIGIDPNGESLKNIMEISHERGRKTAIVTTDYLSGATPAGFSAHASDRDDKYDIMDCQAEGAIDLFIGKFDSTYMSTKKTFTGKGYLYAESLSELNDFSADDKIVGNIKNVDSAHNSAVKDAVPLKDLVEYALDYLVANNEKGFTLMVEGAYIDKHSHNNDLMLMIYAMMDLSDAVDYILDWASERDDTVVIFTADHETGGLVKAEGDVLAKPLYTSMDHTAANVPLYLYGITTDKATLDNTEVYKLAEAVVLGKSE